MSTLGWVCLAVILVSQNFSFTFVSRARNSGSIKRHLVASIFSNGIWFTSQLMIVNLFMGILRGTHGIPYAVFAALFYIAFTISGSLLGHYWALRSEHGSSAVGASKRYAQIPIEQWEQVRSMCIAATDGNKY